MPPARSPRNSRLKPTRTARSVVGDPPRSLPAMISLLRRAGAHPRLLPYAAAWGRSRAVSPRLAFFAGEALRRGEREYTVKATGAKVVVEHGTTDAATMDQAFVQRVYEPSAEAAAALDGLGRPPVVLDLGANIGMYGVWAGRRWPGARVIAVEPLPRNVDRLRRNLAGELPGAHEVVAAAATTADGEITFGGGDFTNGRVLDAGAGDGDGVTLPARDAFALCQGIDLLKLDIEGGEWPILADPRFTADLAPVVMLEHHPMGAPAGTTPEVAAETALQRAGYDVRRTVTEFAGAGILWGVRRA